MKSCQNFSSSVIRERRSRTRSSTGRAASRYGTCGVAVVRVDASSTITMDAIAARVSQFLELTMSSAVVSVVAFLVFISFGVWWTAFPDSVIRFYSWFYGLPGMASRLKSRVAVRAIGILWLLMIVSVFITALWRQYHP